MKDFDQKKLDALLGENRLDEAKEYIHSMLTAADPNAKADAAIEYTLAYIKSINAINASYLKSLRETIDLLKKTKSAEGRADDSIKLAKIKSDLNLN
jgi:hypothetical protein